MENIGPGASRKLVIQFEEPGTYETLCKPGMVGEGVKGSITVTGDAVDSIQGDAALQEAVDDYTEYVRSQAKNLADVTPSFVDAVRAGDVAKANAEQLKKDIRELVDGVNAPDFKLTPVRIASGAQGLLDEVSKSKITGEEDIYSHTDLYDFQANLEGSRAAIAALDHLSEEVSKVQHVIAG